MSARSSAATLVEQNSVRLLVMWCPDWPVIAAGVAAGLALDAPLAVMYANRVIACSATARKFGVRRGIRRRQAQYLCPSLVLAEHDPDRDGRMFEPVAAALEGLAPGIEVVRPGVAAVPARGPAKVFGGEPQAVERIIEHIATEVGVECEVGISEGLFAAFHAARASAIVPREGAAVFLSRLPAAEFTTPLEQVHPRTGKAREQLVDLLRRMGIRTLGEFAALPEREVYSRFGPDALHVHRLAAGRQLRPAVRRGVPAELRVSREFDPALDRIDTAAFAARGLAAEFHAALSVHGLACIRLGVHARTANGEEFRRVWRCADPLSEDGVADRVRWQLEGWLRSTESAPTAGVCEIAIEPVETVDGQAMQFGLWHGAESDRLSTERAGRALVRVQGLLGPNGAATPVLRGGRSPAERVQLVRWGDDRTPETDPALPWPGQLPEPAPATVPDEVLPVSVLDERGDPVGVSGRHQLSAPPYYLVIDRARAKIVSAWAGPWAVDQRWWSRAASRAARIQVLCADGEGLLLLRENGKWVIEGVYD